MSSNIANIKKDERLEIYISAARDTLALIDTAGPPKYDTNEFGEIETVHVGHLYGHVWIDTSQVPYHVCAKLAIGYPNDWHRSWQRPAFSSDRAALAYAAAALRNKLKEQSAEIYAQTKIELAKLECAR